MTAGRFPRAVLPELLDDLPPHDPRAIGSRRDLRVLNAIMLQAGAMASMLQSLRSHPGRPRVIEIGSGDGSFMLAVAKKLRAAVPEADVVLLDRSADVAPHTIAAFAALGWRAEAVEADAFDYLAARRGVCDAITANLFLHHFEAPQLQRLLRLVATRTSLFAACEPRRDAISLAGSRMVWALGCNDVTRHDAVVSVRAGFSGAELSALWPDEPGWDLTERRSRLFTHVFRAALTTAEPHNVEP